MFDALRPPFKSRLCAVARSDIGLAYKVNLAQQVSNQLPGIHLRSNSKLNVAKFYPVKSGRPFLYIVREATRAWLHLGAMGGQPHPPQYTVSTGTRTWKTQTNVHIGTLTFI
jgi:hypothetical protein